MNLNQKTGSDEDTECFFSSIRGLDASQFPEFGVLSFDEGREQNEETNPWRGA